VVYHSVPDFNKIYPDQMSNRELSRFEIQKVTYTADGVLVDHVETVVTVYQTMRMDLTRNQFISQMRQQGCGFYFKEKLLHIEWVETTPFIHLEKSMETRDILE